MDSGLRAFIPSSSVTFSPSNPWFTMLAITDRERVHRSYQSYSELTLLLFISARNHCTTEICRAHSSFLSPNRFMSLVNWVVDPAPPASRRPATGASPAPTPAIFMPSSGAPSQPSQRQKSRRRKAKRLANHNSASRQADLATPAERSANDNSARRRATQPRSTANDLPGMKSTPVEHPHSFTSSADTAFHLSGQSECRTHISPGPL